MWIKHLSNLSNEKPNTFLSSIMGVLRKKRVRVNEIMEELLKYLKMCVLLFWGHSLIIMIK